ncbi:MAG TPA: tetratricopeptide repeat protein [Usitatibacter sp.]|nr:tetratricopeptide repeat protein [Usitatibacter sp.]
MRILDGVHRAALKKRAQEAQVHGSAERRLTLARECTEHQMHEEAIRLYESCLQGACARDSSVLFRLARAAVDAAHWDKAEATIARLKAEAPKTRPLEVRLLEARVLEGRGRRGAAYALYREILPRFMGLEARYRFGMLLMKQGEREAAVDTFNGIVDLGRSFAPSLEEEQRWVAAARQALRAA